MSKVYTYSVNMIIQLVAESDEAKAKEQLDKEGGYVTSRVVKLLNVTNIEEFGVESLPSEEG
jgi:hypothetical protein